MVRSRRQGLERGSLTDTGEGGRGRRHGPAQPRERGRGWPPGSERRERLVRSRPPRVQLDIDQIVDAAMAIADRDGPQAMTMRAIAKELGVGAMSLYWHVADKEQLLWIGTQSGGLGRLSPKKLSV